MLSGSLSPGSWSSENALDLVRQRLVSHGAGMVQAYDARRVQQNQRRRGAASVREKVLRAKGDGHGVQRRIVLDPYLVNVRSLLFRSDIAVSSKPIILCRSEQDQAAGAVVFHHSGQDGH